MTNMKVLFTSPVLEYPTAGGPSLRIESSIKALNQISELHIVSGNPIHYMGGKKAQDYYVGLSKHLTYLPSVKYNFSTGLFYKIKRKLYKILDKLHLKKIDLRMEDAKFLLKYVKKNRLDAIWFAYGNISYDLISRVRSLDKDMKLICDADGVLSRNILRQLPHVKSEEISKKIIEEGRKKELEERKYSDTCDIVTAVSEEDAKYYLDITDKKDKIHLFPNVLDFDNYKKNVDPPKNFKTPNLLLAGYFGKNSPMEHAAYWVIDNVFPIIKKYKPDIHFYLVGRGSKETLGHIVDPDISVVGMVKDILPYLCNCDVSLVPLWFESGTKYKILESAACGIPMVATSIGAESMDFINGKDILIEDEPEKFAKAVLKILDDKVYAKKLAKNCKQIIEAGYGLDRLKNEGRKILQNL